MGARMSERRVHAVMSGVLAAACWGGTVSGATNETARSNEAARVADNAAFFLQGRLIEEGLGKVLFTKPKDKRTEDYVMGRFG